MPFRTRVDVEVYDGHPGEWVVLSDVIWESPAFGTITVPRGFVTDFASTPQFMHALPWFDPTREGRYAALPHDYLYCSHRHSWIDVADAKARGQVWTHAESRLWCDNALRAALVDSGMSPRLAWWYWLGVRAGGGLPWSKRGDGLNDEDFVPPTYWPAAAVAAGMIPP